MGWKNDDHGIIFKPSECKLYSGSHTWGMKISQVGVQQFPDFVGIATFSFQLEYAANQLRRLPEVMQFVCNQKFLSRARQLKKAVPRARVFVNPLLHQKLLLIPDKTVYLGSMNMINPYSTKNSESTIGIRSPEAFQWALDNLWTPLINTSQEVLDD